MATLVYTTKDGDALDAICKDHYGSEVDPINYVLDANPDLASLGLIYSSGVRILLPDLPAADDTVPTIKLWS